MDAHIHIEILTCPHMHTCMHADITHVHGWVARDAASSPHIVVDGFGRELVVWWRGMCVMASAGN